MECDILRTLKDTEKRRLGKEMRAQKIWTATGCGLWIIGIAVFIIGLNMSGNTGSWMTLSGSIAFLIGMGITGAVRMKRKRDDKSAASD